MIKWNREKVRFIAIRTIGNFLVLFSLFGIIMTFGPAVYFEAGYRLNQLRNVRYAISFEGRTAHEEIAETVPTPTQASSIKNTLFGQLTGGNAVEYLTPVSAEFGLVIPKIGANAPIFPNIDAGKPDVYLEILKHGVAHAYGTVFPGVKGNIYLFAHSTDNFWNVGRYNAVFYLLKDLENGDEIDVFFQNVRHVYRVVNKLTVDPGEINYLTNILSYEQLTLQTCWPPGTTYKRLLIIAKPEKDII